MTPRASSFTWIGNISFILISFRFSSLAPFSDVNAGVNFVLIDEAVADGKIHPLRFQSEYYKRVHLASPLTLSPNETGFFVNTGSLG